MSQAKAQKIFIAGHQGMVGSALVRVLQQDTNNCLLYTSDAADEQCMV